MRYSNCFISALSAKIKWGSQIKIIFVPPWKNDAFCPHFMWLDKEYIYDWYADKYPLKWYEELWHKGFIRTRPISSYERWIKTKQW